jgi:Family of unknown function (DUF6175)
MRKLLQTLCMCCVCLGLWGQDEQYQAVQPTIMVVPWTSKDEDMRAKVDNDFAYRAILNEIRAAFDKRGVTTLDFIEAMRNAATNRATGFSNWRDIFKDVIDNSPSDVFIEAEIYQQSSKYGPKIQILLSAKEKYTSESLLSSGLLESPESQADPAKKVQVTLEKDDVIGKFINDLNGKFLGIVKKGRIVSIRVEVNSGSSFKLDAEAGTNGDYVSDLIIDWMKKNAYQNYYHTKANGSTLLEFDQVKIPLRNPDGSNYDINEFGRNMRKAIAQIGKQTEKGSTFKMEQNIRGNVLTLSILP